MNTSITQATPYSVTRLTVDVPRTFEDFQEHYEQAAPPMPREEVDALVARGAPWSEMNALIAGAAPLGFLIYWKNDAHSVMRLAGDTAKGTFYLMGNHTIAERMYRHQPAVMLCAPLHTMIWESPDSATHFTFNRPSDQFGSFEMPAITAVGMELDQKDAATSRTGRGPVNLATIRAVIAAFKDAGYLHVPEGRRDRTTPVETLHLHGLD